MWIDIKLYIYRRKRKKYMQCNGIIEKWKNQYF